MFIDYFLDQDLPIFPVEAKQIQQLKQRIELVTELELLEYRMQKEMAKRNWFEKTAEQADLPGVDEDGDEPPAKRRRKKKNRRDSDDEDEENFLQQTKSRLKMMEKQLKRMLAERLSKASVTVSKYPFYAGATKLSEPEGKL